MSEGKSPYWQRLDALAALMPYLTPLRFQLLFLYVKHADREGDAYPSNRRLADYLGHKKTTRVEAEKKWLVEQGYLQRIEAGGGSKAAVFRVNLTLPRAGGGSPPPSRGVLPSPGPGGNPPPSRGVNPPPSRGVQLSIVEQPMNTPPGETMAGALAEAFERLSPGDDPLDVEIRHWIGDHPMLTYDAKTHAKARKLVRAVGWAKAKELVAEAIKQGASFPLGYALSIAARIEQQRAATAGPTKTPLVPTAAQMRARFEQRADPKVIEETVGKLKARSA